MCIRDRFKTWYPAFLRNFVPRLKLGNTIVIILASYVIEYWIFSYNSINWCVLASDHSIPNEINTINYVSSKLYNKTKSDDYLQQKKKKTTATDQSRLSILSTKSQKIEHSAIRKQSCATVKKSRDTPCHTGDFVARQKSLLTKSRDKIAGVTSVLVFASHFVTDVRTLPGGLDRWDWEPIIASRYDTIRLRDAILTCARKPT